MLLRKCFKFREGQMYIWPVIGCVQIGGPIWSGPLHDETFVSRLEHLAGVGEFGTARRMQGVLAVVGEELPDVPLYYTLDRLCSVMHCECMPMMHFR